MIRLPIVRDEKRRLLYYPIRKAASSSIQYALGYDFISRSVAEQLPDYTRFTVWRDPVERFASIYVGSISPARSGFYQPFARMGLREGQPFDEYIHTICTTDDHLRDPHFQLADWPLHDSRILALRFTNLAADLSTIGLTLRERIGDSYAHDHPLISPTTRSLIERTYSLEYVLFASSPQSED